MSSKNWIAVPESRQSESHYGKSKTRCLEVQALIKLLNYREDDDLIVYLDKTWFVSHDTVRMLCSASTKSCYLSGPPPKGKREVKCHAGKSKSFLEHSLLFCGK